MYRQFSGARLLSNRIHFIEGDEMNSSIYYFLYLKLSKLNNVTILGAALLGQKLAKRAVSLMPDLASTSHPPSDICYLEKRK